MRITPKQKLAALGIALLVGHAAIEAAINYLKVDTTPTFNEALRAVYVAAMGTFLYWVRSPKDVNRFWETEEEEPKPSAVGGGSEGDGN